MIKNNNEATKSTTITYIENEKKLPQKTILFTKDSHNLDSLSLKSDKFRYIDSFNFYLNYFHYIPNLMQEFNIFSKKANEWFCNTYHAEIKDYYYSKKRVKSNKKTEIDEVIYILHNDLLVFFDLNDDCVSLFFRNTDIAFIETILSQLQKFRIKIQPDSPEIMLIVQSSRGLDTKSLDITKPKLNIEDNYNDDFLPIHQLILKRLKLKNDKGLVLLYGKPGTGKTSYIRYLIGSVKKNVIFLPPDMASNITNPGLISILIDNPNAIFVIEDAERLIVDRETEDNSPVSALLNITDGLLADCLNVQIICSFNTDISKVDAALLRKGRLIAKYEFGELQTNKAQALSKKLGFKNEINQSMILSDIYNQEDLNFEIQKKRTIGFK